jgi:catechol 2,3-dioxygenase-like lactoylglutathione lyase family enzyme
VTYQLLRLDHVQLAIPPGTEEAADEFYVGVLGMEMIPKPPPVAARGGRWYVSGPITLHLGVDPEFRPSPKSHPALVVAGFDDLSARLAAAGLAVEPDVPLAGARRGYVTDPFGNRIELIETPSIGE